MANSKSATARAKKSERKRQKNRSQVSKYKTALKKIDVVIFKEDTTDIMGCFSKAQEVIDKAAAKGLIHKNKRDRLKSKLAKKINSIVPPNPKFEDDED